MKKFLPLSILIILSLVLAACGAQATPEPTQAPPTPEPTEEPMEEAPSIVDIAVEDGRYTTLVTALQAAGLVEALQGDGPFTVFAPTDDAFAALPEGDRPPAENFDRLRAHIQIREDMIEAEQAKTTPQTESAGAQPTMEGEAAGRLMSPRLAGAAI